MRKILLLIIMGFYFLLNQYGQDGFTVRGTITDEFDQPLIGVNIVEKGTTNGAVTDLDGNYTINVSGPDVTLEFSSIGYLSEQVAVDGQSVINMNMVPSMEELSEVVVVGYGTQKKADLTSAISTVSTETIQETPLSNTQSLLQGKASGVKVMANSGSPGSSVNVTIRGNLSLGEAQPLYVVDGIPMSSAGGGADNGFGINSLNPNDIESIQILKDASAQAIYGSRGSNGVILITTKRGKAGEMKVNLNAYYGIQTLARKIDVLDKAQYREYNLIVDNDEDTDLHDPEAYAQLPDYDWQDEIFDNSPISNVQLSISGGDENSNYMMSISNNAQTGMVNTSGYNRTNFRLNSDHQVRNWLKVGESFMVTYSNRDRVQESGAGYSSITANPVMAALLSDPLTEAYNDLGEWNYMRTATFNGAGLRDRANYRYQNKKMNGSVYSEISFLNDFKFRTNLGVDYNTGEVREFLPAFEVIGSPRNEAQLVPTLKQNTINTTYLIMENILTYNRTFGKHSFSLMAASTVESWDQYFIEGKNNSMLSNADNFRYFDAGDPDEITLDGGADYWRMYSYLGRATYNFDERYLLTASVRQDASSKFGPENRKGVFPAFSAGWRFTQEEFMQDVDWIYNGKIRFGWGQVGNQSTIGTFRYTTPIAINANYLFGIPKTIYSGVTAGLNYPQGYASPGSSGIPGNKGLTWETTMSTNFGLDLSFFKGSVSFAADWFQKENIDMLLVTSVPLYTGSGAPTVNGGKIVNNGYELEVGFHKSRGVFNFDISANMSHIKTDVVDLAGQSDLFNSNRITAGNEASRTIEGGGIADFWGYKTDGIFRSLEELKEGPYQSNAQIGDVRFVDVNGDGIITGDDQTVLGSPIPNYTFGLSANTQYKNIQLNLFFQGNADYQIYNNTYRLMMGRYGLNKHVDILNSWSWGNPDAELPVVQDNSRHDNLVLLSDRWLQDASYLRLQTATLSYILPDNLTSKIRISNVKIYVTVQNVFLLTNYKGFDPEIGKSVSWKPDPLDMGVDNGNYPMPRTYIAGFNLTF